MKKILIGLVVLLSAASIFADSSRFDGSWNSKGVDLTVNQGSFSNCKSDINITIDSKQVVIKSPVLVLCDNFTFFTDTLPLDLLEGGVLSNSRSRARGIITENIIEIYTPNLFPDGSFVDSYAKMSLVSDNEMSVELKLKHADYILDLKGTYQKH
jgi:hypothetical protein